jgi:hypothetical protein
MNRAREQRLLEDRRSARLAALTKARRARRRELALVEQYLAQIRFSRAPRTRPWQALAPLSLGHTVEPVRRADAGS